MAKLKNIHPGEILLEEFLVPMNLSQNALARAISVPSRRINEIVFVFAVRPSFIHSFIVVARLWAKARLWSLDR